MVPCLASTAPGRSFASHRADVFETLDGAKVAAVADSGADRFMDCCLDFTSLPEPDVQWWKVLGFNLAPKSRQKAEDAYRTLAKTHHPDVVRRRGKVFPYIKRDRAGAKDIIMTEPTGVHAEIWEFLLENFVGVENKTKREAIIQRFSLIRKKELGDRFFRKVVGPGDGI